VLLLLHHVLPLLYNCRFQGILQRESLKSDLDSKLNIIFQNYGMELEQVQALYERQKHDPPVPRNLPPVAGNITWSRHLLKRIEEPMKHFESNQNVLAGKVSVQLRRVHSFVAVSVVLLQSVMGSSWQQL
jgi:dynein heavy chain, axonemal